MEKSILTSVILPASLGVIMLGMGLSLTIGDFKRVIKFPKAAFIGLFNQIILLPIVAFLLIKLMGLSAGLAIGVMILAACPGGTTSNIITHVSKGDTALSVTLTAISTIITFFSIPFIVNFAIGYYESGDKSFQLPIPETIGALFLITILPVSIGMIIKRYNNSFALKMDRPVRVASLLLFVLIIIGIIVKNRAQVVDFILEAGAISILLNATTMLLGFGAAKLFALPLKQSITIAIESGIQNGTLALLIATELIKNANPELSIAPATYGLLMFISGGLMMYFFGRKAAQSAA